MSFEVEHLITQKENFFLMKLIFSYISLPYANFHIVSYFTENKHEFGKTVYRSGSLERMQIYQQCNMKPCHQLCTFTFGEIDGLISPIETKIDLIIIVIVFYLFYHIQE